MTRARLILGAGAAGGLGAIATAIGFALAPTQAAFSYLTAWAYAVSIALGALIFLMIGHAVGARWTVVFQRLTEIIVGALPALALLFVPIALSLPRLYPWADPALFTGDAAAKLAHKAAYLNAPFWLARAAVFWGVWIAIAELLARRGRDRALASVGLPAIGLTLTFAAFDWLMSLTPLWTSTIFGLIYFAGGFVAALALVAVIAQLARGVPAVARNIGPGHTGALGRLMFAFLVFWAYMELSQGLIIWIANKPDEVPWYVARGAGQWGHVFALLVIGHFALPFFGLMPRAVKRRSGLLAIAGGWLLALHYVDVYWLVMPVLHPQLAPSWIDLAALVGVVGVATCFALLRRRARAAIALDDPALDRARGYEGT